LLVRLFDGKDYYWLRVRTFLGHPDNSDLRSAHQGGRSLKSGQAPETSEKSRSGKKRERCIAAYRKSVP